MATQNQSQAPKKRGYFKLDVDDMERRLVEFRVNLDREKRRCQQAQMSDKFEKLLCDKLSEIRQQCGSGGGGGTGDSEANGSSANPESEIKLTTLDDEGMARLKNFLTYIVQKCARIDQQELLQTVLRQSLADTRRKRIQTQMTLPSDKAAPQLEPFCLFCASSLGGDYIGGNCGGFGLGVQRPAAAAAAATGAPPAHSCPNSQEHAPQPLCAPPVVSRANNAESGFQAIITELPEERGSEQRKDMPEMYIPEIQIVLPNSAQDVTPPPSAATTPEVGEQARAPDSGDHYTPSVGGANGQAQNRLVLQQANRRRQQQQQEQQVDKSTKAAASAAAMPESNSQQVNSTTATSQPSAPAPVIISQQNIITNASNNKNNQQQQQQQQQQPKPQQPRVESQAAAARMSQLSTGSGGFVMPSDDEETSSDSDANSIRNVLDSLNRSRATPDLSVRGGGGGGVDQATRTSTPLSDAEENVSGKLVIDEYQKSPIKRQLAKSADNDDDDEEAMQRRERYDFFAESESEREEEEFEPKIKLSHSNKLAKSLKQQQQQPLPRTGGEAAAAGHRSKGVKDKKQQQQSYYARITNSKYVLLSSPSSSSSAVSSLSQHQAKFRTGRESVGAAAAAAGAHSSATSVPVVANSSQVARMSTSATAGPSKTEMVSSRLLKEAATVDRVPRTKKRPKRASSQLSSSRRP